VQVRKRGGRGFREHRLHVSCIQFQVRIQAAWG
jgi:hypothetical protein